MQLLKHLIYALQANTGAASLVNITLDSVAFGQLSHDLECADLPLSTLGPQQSSIVCTGTVTPDQAAFDAGPVQLSVVLAAGPDSVQAMSNILVVTPLRAAVLHATIDAAACRAPYAAGKVLILSAGQPLAGVVLFYYCACANTVPTGTHWACFVMPADSVSSIAFARLPCRTAPLNLE